MFRIDESIAFFRYTARIFDTETGLFLNGWDRNGVFLWHETNYEEIGSREGAKMFVAALERNKIRLT